MMRYFIECNDPSSGISDLHVLLTTVLSRDKSTFVTLLYERNEGDKPNGFQVVTGRWPKEGEQDPDHGDEAIWQPDQPQRRQQGKAFVQPILTKLFGSEPVFPDHLAQTAVAGTKFDASVDKNGRLTLTESDPPSPYEAVSSRELVAMVQSRTNAVAEQGQTLRHADLNRNGPSKATPSEQLRSLFEAVDELRSRFGQ